MNKKMEALRDSAPMRNAFDFLQSDDAHTLEQQIEIAQIPSFSNHEKNRADHIRAMIEAEGYETKMDDAWNVYTRIKGTGDGPTLYVSAHMDTVFPMDTPLDMKRDGVRINIPGIGDDVRGCAEILAYLRAIREAGLKPVGDIIIGGNVGEEGLGNLRGMRQFFSENADEVDAFISVDSAMPVLCYGATGSHRYKVTFRGPGGHSMGAFGLVNPIHAMGRAISYFAELRVPMEPRTTFNVGVVEGGTSVNSIAYECSMMVDMRSNDQAELEDLDRRFHECVQKAVDDEYARWEEERKEVRSVGHGFDTEAHIEVEFELVGDRPAATQSADCELVRILSAAFEATGIEPAWLDHGSTDSNIPLSLGIPAATIAGGGLSGNAHSVAEWFDPTDAYKGAQKNLLAIFAMVGLDGVSEPMLSKRSRS